ncbi:hypothetical protein, partial [Endozoicomonas atrinae]|uniref:hypothetical protein n=1 Tax=Endozoicomonas atrinae TaxID=1333660 RepID=UPI000ADD7C6F
GPLRLKLKPLEQKLGQAIHVLQSETELPSSLYQKVISDKAQGRVRGMFDPETGETYLIAANLDTTGEAVRTVLHELVGHKGVRGLLGKRLDTVLDEIHRDMNDRLKQALGKRYARQTEGKSEAEANRIIAEEYLAHLAEKDPKNGLLTKVVSMIRNALRRLFPSIKWTDADAVELLSAARGHLKRNGNLNAGNAKGNRYSDSGIAPTFYSAVERSAAAVKSDKLPAQSWLNAIKKGNNVQDEEVQWLGLDLWLADKKGEKLSRAEVLDFIRQNEVRISEDWNVDSFDEQELEDRLESKQRDFIRERIDDYEHGYSLDELGDALEDARESLREEEYDYQYQELKNRFDDEDLDDHEVEALVDDDGYLDESALHEEAQWRANNSVDNMDDKELVRDHISYSDKEDAALEVWENDYESDYRSDLESELRDESDIQYRQYAMKGGEDYTELVLVLDDNRHVFPGKATHKNHSPITDEEAETLSKGNVPSSMRLTDGLGLGWYDWSLLRYDDSNGQQVITTGHATEASAIAAALEGRKPFARWEQDAFLESHWGETANVLAHVRFQTFDENVQGRNERILFIDEVQSDWHQLGRQHGYQTPEKVQEQEKLKGKRKSVRDRLKKMETRLELVKYDLREALDQKDRFRQQSSDNLTDEYQKARDQELYKANERVNELVRRNEQLKAEIKTLEAQRDSLTQEDIAQGFSRTVPDAPLKENWPNLVMKRMIRHAAAEGFDRIAWSNAAQQVERYPSLGQVVESLKVSPEFTSSGRLMYFALDIRQRTGNNRREHIAEERLEAYVGNAVGGHIREQAREIQDRLRQRVASYEPHHNEELDLYEVVDANGEHLYDQFGDLETFRNREYAENYINNRIYGQHNESFTLDNLDDVIGDNGARGMKAFYDKRLANYMKKYTKKWGAKLEPINMNFKEQGFPYDIKPDKVWSVTVTDKMKDSVLKDGQPLFALKDDPQGWGKFHQAPGTLKGIKARLGQKDNKPDSSPRYALKDLPDDVEAAINNAVHGGGKSASWPDRVKAWFVDTPIARWARQKTLNTYDSVEHYEKLGNEGKLHDAALSASKMAHFTRAIDDVMNAMLGKGSPLLKDGSVVFKEGSKGFLDIFEPVATRGELKLWESWAGSLRAQRLMNEDAEARKKGQAMMARGQALKETVNAVAPEQYPGGRNGWDKDRKQADNDLKLGKALSEQSRENNYDQKTIDTLQNYVNTQPQMKARFEQAMQEWQSFNNDVLDFAVDAGLIDRDVRKLWDTGDYIPFHRVHDLEGKEEAGQFFKSGKGLSGKKSGIQKLTGGVEKISPIEAMFRNTRSLMDASFKNIAMQRIVKDATAAGALEYIDASIRLGDDDVLKKLRDMGESTDLTPAQMKRWKALFNKYTELGEGTVSVSENGKLKHYLVHDKLLLASIQDLGAPNFGWMMKLL